MRRLLILAACAAAALLTAAPAQAADCTQQPQNATSIYLSTVENAAVNRILTLNEPFGPLDGRSSGMYIVDEGLNQDPCVVETYEVRGYGTADAPPANAYVSPCYGYDTIVTKQAGHYYGGQTVWHVQCSTGGPIGGPIVQRTWDRYTG